MDHEDHGWVLLAGADGWPAAAVAVKQMLCMVFEREAVDCGPHCRRGLQQLQTFPAENDCHRSALTVASLIPRAHAGSQHSLPSPLEKRSDGHPRKEEWRPPLCSSPETHLGS